MKQKIAVILLLVLTLSLSACGSDDQGFDLGIKEGETQPSIELTEPTEIVITTAPTEVVETTQATQPEVTTEPTQATEPQQTEPQYNPVPYVATLDGACAIFDRPGSGRKYVQNVEISGLYTIVEERYDDDGNLWGKLKSGAGWVMLNGNVGNGKQICSRCGTTDPGLFGMDWMPGGMCFDCARYIFHFGEGGGIFCTECGADCSYRGVEADGRCEDCHSKSYVAELLSHTQIFQAPDANSTFVDYVGVAGSYTIVQEAYDSQGNLWGKLKSGAGWVMLIERSLVCDNCGGYFPYKGLHADGLCEECYEDLY